MQGHEHLAGALRLDEDLQIDAALQQYMYDIEQCTTDLTHTPPSLHDLPSLTNDQQQNIADTRSHDALFHNLEPLTSCGVPLAEQESECDQEPTTSKATKRTEAWAAKNRRAQKRFRERQKAQKGDMQQQLSRMEEKLKQLQVENSNITQRNSILEKALVIRENEITELQDQSKILDAESDSSNLLSSPLTVSLNQAASSVQADRVIQTYRGLVNLMAGLLLRLDQEGESDPLLQQMRSATRQSGQLSMQTAVLAPELMTTLMRVNMESCDTQVEAMLQDRSSNSPEHWQQVADLLDLQPDQRRDMLNLHARFLQKLEDNRNRRRHLCIGLHQGSDKVKKLHAATATEAQKYIASMFEVHREVGQLRDNLREQHRIWLDFYSTVFHVWDTVQHCRAVVHSFPRYPDILQICTCMKAQEQSSTH